MDEYYKFDALRGIIRSEYSDMRYRLFNWGDNGVVKIGDTKFVKLTSYSCRNLGFSVSIDNIRVMTYLYSAPTFGNSPVLEEASKIIWEYDSPMLRNYVVKKVEMLLSRHDAAEQSKHYGLWKIFEVLDDVDLLKQRFNINTNGEQ